MKKLTAVVLLIILCLSLCACGASKNVSSVEGKISAIGRVSLESGPAIIEAEEAFNALTEKEKASVKNYDSLVAARNNYDYFKKIREQLIGQWGYYDAAGDIHFITFMKNDMAYMTHSDNHIRPSLGTITYGAFGIDEEYIYLYRETLYSVLTNSGPTYTTGKNTKMLFRYSYENGNLCLSYSPDYSYSGETKATEEAAKPAGSAPREYTLEKNDWDSIFKQMLVDAYPNFGYESYWKEYTDFCDTHRNKK